MANDCSCDLCYLREVGWNKWYERNRGVWSGELNSGVPVKDLQYLEWVWLNSSRIQPKGSTIYALTILPNLKKNTYGHIPKIKNLIRFIVH